MGIHKMFRIGFIHHEAQKICEMFTHPKTRIDLVTLPEELPMQESKELKEKLQAMAAFPLGYLVVNQCLPAIELDEIPPALPEKTQRTLQNFQQRKHAEREALELAAEIALPEVHIPRFATENLLGTIELTTQYLEGE
jgi:hypothetical protein